MARIITAGNETGDWEGDGFTVYTGSPGTSANQPYRSPSPGNSRGRWSFYLTNNQGIQYDVTTQVPGGITECWFRIVVYMGGRCDGQQERFRLLSPTGALILTFDTIDAGGGSVSGGYWYPFCRNNVGGTLASNSSHSVRNNDWVTIEMHVKLSTGADGEFDVWMGRQKVMEYRGQLVSSTLEDKLGSLVLYYHVISGAANSTYYDDIALNDSTGTVNNGRVGVGYVLPFWPAGTGTTSQLTNIFNTSVDNFKFVNKEVANNPSGFVGTSTPNDKDTYALPPVPDEFWGVNAVRVAAYGVRSGPTITKAKMLLKPPAQAEIDLPSGVGVGITLPIGAPAYFYEDFDSNPNSSNEPFTKAEMDGMEAGIQFIA